MMSFFILLWLLPILSEVATAAYVRSESCTGFTPPQTSLGGFLIDSLQATYHDELLMVQVGIGFDDSQTCDPAYLQAVERIDVLGSAIGDSTSSNFTCIQNIAPQVYPGGYGWLTTTASTQGKYLVNTFDTKILLQHNNKTLNCVQGSITPIIPSSLVLTVKYVPIGILVLSVVVSIIDAYKRRSNPIQSAISGSDSAEALIPGFCDCLQYIQFIFLSGCLNLHFPDYFRVIIGQASWSTLLNPLITRKDGFRYSAMADGIYVFNSTSGFEGMSQILGVERVPDLWRNILINSAIAMAAAGVFVLVFGIFERWNRNRDDKHLSFMLHLRRVGWNVLRVAFNYFSVPIIAFNWCMLTTYLSPLHTRIICAVILSGIVIALMIAMKRLMYQNRGYIFLTDATSTRHTVRLSLGSFAAYEFYIAIFLRGSIIGIVQLPGVVQIPLLAFNEIVLLITLLKVWPAGTGRLKQILFTSTRLVVLVSCLVYVIPGPQHAALGYAFAYVIMGFHAFALLSGSLAFAIWGLCRSSTAKKDLHSDSTSEPQVSQYEMLLNRGLIWLDFKSLPTFSSP